MRNSHFRWLILLVDLSLGALPFLVPLCMRACLHLIHYAGNRQDQDKHSGSSGAANVYARPCAIDLIVLCLLGGV